jgi:hypothetical protein
VSQTEQKYSSQKSRKENTPLRKENIFRLEHQNEKHKQRANKKKMGCLRMV